MYATLNKEYYIIDQRSWCCIHISFGAEAAVKRGVEQELALPLTRKLLVSFEDCQNCINDHLLSRHMVSDRRRRDVMAAHRR